MNFFSFISSNIIKWWQIHITPILHINNNKKGRDRFEGGDGSLQNHQAADLAEQTAGSTEQAAGTIGYAAGSTEQAAGTIGHAAESIERAIESGGHALNDAVTASDDVENVQGYMPSKKSAETHTINSDLLKHEIPKGTSADAMEVLNRINREKEEARKRAVEKQWKKRQEEERIAEIMNAGKVDVDAFIEEGRSMAAEKNDSVSKAESQSTGGTTATETVNSPETNEADTSGATDEQLRRAQEIIDRLNREAAEDEAKKQAEIDAAKQRAIDAGLSD
ncbi:MAG: hypothetical protein J6P57_04860 [Lachnospiraceae bacterium]|nr:hypothetical protein [Lachnospiraceae bacterium]